MAIITTSELAAHLRLDSDSSPLPEQAVLSNIIDAASSHLEEICDSTFSTKTVVQFMHDYPYENYFKLYSGPIVSVTSIQTLQEDYTYATFTSTNYRLVSDGRNDYVYLKSGSTWPNVFEKSLDSVKVTSQAGFTTIPPAIKQATLLIAADLYVNRVEQIEGRELYTNRAVANLIAPYRRGVAV